MKGITFSRRTFMRGAGGFAIVPVVVALATTSHHAFAEGEVFTQDKLVDPDKDPVAKALKYVSDASKAEGRKAARMGVDAAQQFCNNCSLYQAKGKLKENGEEVGKCTMLTSGLVKGKGWCNSWAKKA